MNVRAAIVTTLIIVAVHVLVLFLVFTSGGSDAAEKMPAPADTAVPEKAVSEPEVQTETTEEVTVPPPAPVQTVKPSPAKSVPAKQIPPAKPDVSKNHPVQRSAPVPQSVPPGNRKPAVITPEPFRPLNFKDAKTGNPDKNLVLRGNSAQRVTGILLDLDSRKVLWQKDVNRVVPIASLSKLMTLLLACEILSDPTTPYTLDTPVTITKEARNVPPSGVDFKKDETSFPMELLLIAASVKSANDATYLIAQTLGGGNAKTFVGMMNQRAMRLGMKNTNFYNPHGLNEKSAKNDNRSTVADLVRLSEACLAHPEICRWTSMRLASFRTKNDLSNHNNLLPGARTSCQGTTGLKTGFTQRAGFCVSAVCQRNGRRLLAIVTGFSTARERDEFVRSLFAWGFKR